MPFVPLARPVAHGTAVSANTRMVCVADAYFVERYLANSYGNRALPSRTKFTYLVDSSGAAGFSSAAGCFPGAVSSLRRCRLGEYSAGVDRRRLRS